LASKNKTPLAISLSLVLPSADPELFSDVASKNSQLLASLASVLKNLSTPLLYVKSSQYQFIPQFNLENSFVDQTRSSVQLSCIQ
jgi:hypothetical protein